MPVVRMEAGKAVMVWVKVARTEGEEERGCHTAVKRNTFPGYAIAELGTLGAGMATFVPSYLIHTRSLLPPNLFF